MHELALDLEDADTQKTQIAWIDWVVSALFISTEFTANTFATALPTALMDYFELSPSQAGVSLAVANMSAMIYLIFLPWMPQYMNPPNPRNLVRAQLLVAFSGLCIAASFAAGLHQPRAPPPLPSTPF